MDKTKLIKKATDLISINLGASTARSYYDFYNDKDNNTILQSLNELLTETIGPKSTKKQIDNMLTTE